MNVKLILYFLLYSVTISAYGHDTAHIHPLITLEIGKLIRDVDTDGVDTAVNSENSYQEIYELNPGPIDNVNLPVENQFLYWGTDFDPADYPANGTQGEKEDHLLKLDSSRYARYNNVIDGVVQEDIPVEKVLKHFYQAENGEGLSMTSGVLPFASSAKTAMNYFNQSVRWMSGYDSIDAVAAVDGHIDYSAKQHGFFIFGQALHHVEDMSSPAHIHNDAHLTFLNGVFEEKDDYEAWYLPFLKMTAGVNLDTYFTNATSIRAVNNPWNDVWNSQPGSMVKYFYDRTVYRETLHFPLSIKQANVLGGAYARPLPPPDPTEELAAMFPCKDTTGAPDFDDPACLHWDEDNLLEPAHWRINAVGDYQHQFVSGSSNSWWPVEVEADASAVTSSNPRAGFNGVSARYYIEQLSSGNTDGSIFLPGLSRDIAGTPVIPRNMRTDFNGSWTGAQIPNSIELRQIYAEKLLSPAVEFGAGFTQYWYDIANTPPYLQSVQVIQTPSGGGSPETVYSSNWLDTIKHENVFFTNVTSCDPLHLKCFTSVTGIISLVDSRTQKVESDKLGRIHDKQNLTVELTFNEPIQNINQLLIDTVDVTSHTTSAVKSGGDSVWTITIPGSALTGLNGKLQLTVKATDKNKHRRGSDCSADGIPDNAGGELDSAPGTPARRDISIAQASIDTTSPRNCYPWYIGDSVDVDTTPDDKYSYDFASGDQNHWLVFDTREPSATITIDTILVQ